MIPSSSLSLSLLFMIKRRKKLEKGEARGVGIYSLLVVAVVVVVVVVVLDDRSTTTTTTEL